MKRDMLVFSAFFIAGAVAASLVNGDPAALIILIPLALPVGWVAAWRAGR